MPSTFKHPAHVPMWRGAKVAYFFIAMCVFPIAIGGFWAYGNLVSVPITTLYSHHFIKAWWFTRFLTAAHKGKCEILVKTKRIFKYVTGIARSELDGWRPLWKQLSGWIEGNNFVNYRKSMKYFLASIFYHHLDQIRTWDWNWIYLYSKCSNG